MYATLTRRERKELLKQHRALAKGAHHAWPWTNPQVILLADELATRIDYLPRTSLIIHRNDETRVWYRCDFKFADDARTEPIGEPEPEVLASSVPSRGRELELVASQLGDFIVSEWFRLEMLHEGTPLGDYCARASSMVAARIGA